MHPLFNGGGAAYWFTSSASFANPAISIGRMFSDTFAGIAPPGRLPPAQPTMAHRRSRTGRPARPR